MSTDSRIAYGTGRMTSARRAIAEAVDSMPGAFTVEELAARVRGGSSTGSLATLYRAVAAMEHARHIERVGTKHGSALYAKCGCRDGHHHHVVCDSCGRVATALCPVGPEFTAGLAAEGFSITRHEMTLYGLCDTCSSTQMEA